MMTIRRSAKAWTCVIVASAAVLISTIFCGESREAAAAARSKMVSHRVQAVYFHRTQRCPTCKKISAYIEEALQTGFAEELKDGQLTMHLIDFQNPRNQQYAKAYQISGPTFVLANTHDNRVTEWRPMPKVWSLVYKKDAFLKYVQDGIRSYMEKR